MMNQRDVSDIVIIQTAFIGDVILTTGLLSLLQEEFPQVRLHMITTPAGVRALYPWRDVKFYAFDKRKKLRGLWMVAKNVRHNLREDSKVITLQVHKSLTSTLLALTLGFQRITYYETIGSFWQTYERVFRIAVFHEVHRIGLLAEPLGVSRQQVLALRPYLQPFSNPQFDHLKDRQGQILIGVAVGSVWPTKRWPVEKFIQLLAKVSEHHEDIKFVLIGGQEDIELAQTVENQLKGRAQLLNLTGQTSLRDLRVVMPQLDVLLSNDSAPVHYASAFNLPCLAIFGPTLPEMGFAPLSAGSDVVEIKDLKCRPCGLHGAKKCPLKHFRCMNDIRVEDVFVKLEKIIQELATKP